MAVLLALFVLATAVSGCGNSGSSSADSQSGSSATSENSASTEDTASTDGEVPTISLMVVCGTTPPDADAVAEKLSKITREKIGCNVEFITMEIGNVSQQLNLLLSGGDDTLDVFVAGISVPYSTIVNNGQALSLDSLMEPYAEEMKTALGENVYGIENPDRYGAIGALSPAVFSKKDMESKKTKGPQWVDLYAATEKAVAEGKKLPDLFLSIGDRDFLYKNVQEYHKFVEPIWKSGRLRYDDLPGYEHEFAIWDLEINNFLDWIDRGDVYKKMGANKV